MTKTWIARLIGPLVLGLRVGFVAAGQSVPLTLHFPTDAEGEQLPVTFGLPMPSGYVTDPASLVLKTPAGQDKRPFVARVQARWPDGSIRWLLLDLQARPGQDENLSLQLAGSPQTSPEPASPLRVTANPMGIEVDTGTLRFFMPRTRFALESIHVRANLDAPWRAVPLAGEVPVADWHRGEWMKANLTGGEFALQDYYYREYATRGFPGACQVEIEELSPLRAVIKCTGQHSARVPRRVEKKSLFDFVIRMHVYAGKPYIRMFYTLVNDQTDEDFCVLRCAEFRLPLGDNFTHWEFGGDQGSRQGDLKSDGPVRLLQTGPTRWTTPRDFTYTISRGEQLVGQGNQAPGWVQVSNTDVGLLVAVRKFAMQHPKSLEIDGHVLRVGLWPDHHQTMPFPTGMAKTHEILLAFSAGPEPRTAQKELLAWFEQPPLFTVPPRWFAESQPWGAMTVWDERKFTRYEQQNQLAYRGVLYSRQANRAYGVVDFGDMAFNDFHWMNSEYDQAHALFMNFARSARPEFYYLAEEMARHYYDVDVLHHSPDPKFNGKPIKHGEAHTGHRDRDGQREYDLGHVWLEGPLDLYLLQGDRRGLDVARAIADHLALCVEHKYYDPVGAPQRDTGWPLIALTSFYRIEREHRYLQAANVYTYHARIWQNPMTGAWLERAGFAKPFMVGILLHGLARHHEESGYEEVPPLIIRGVDWLLREAWMDDGPGFVYATRPGDNDRASPGDMRPLPGLAYAYKLTRNKEILRVLLKALDTGLDPEHQARSITQYRRGKGFLTVNLSCEEAIALVDKLGLWRNDRPDWEAFAKLE